MKTILVLFLAAYALGFVGADDGDDGDFAQQVTLRASVKRPPCYVGQFQIRPKGKCIDKFCSNAGHATCHLGTRDDEAGYDESFCVCGKIENANRRGYNKLSKGCDINESVELSARCGSGNDKIFWGFCDVGAEKVCYKFEYL